MEGQGWFQYTVVIYISTSCLPPEADSCEAAVECSTAAQDARPPLVFRRDKRGRAAAEDMDTETSWEGAEQVRESGKTETSLDNLLESSICNSTYSRLSNLRNV